MTLFDTHVVVDWSARSRPSPARRTKDAIYFAVVRDGVAEYPTYCRTRHEARSLLRDLVISETSAGRRALIGFDFPFGYPAGVAERITGQPNALSLLEWFADQVEDDEGNRSNRYVVAERINRLYDGIGPFWGRPASWNHPDIPTRAQARHGGDHPPERRLADNRAKGAKTVWQLAYAGSVGSQVVVGLPTLMALRNDPDLSGAVAIWPFDTGLDRGDAPCILAEIYPSLLQKQAHASKGDDVLDAAQVLCSARAFAELDRTGILAPLFAGAPDLTDEDRATIIREEAWILGLGHETTLIDACSRSLAA